LAIDFRRLAQFGKVTDSFEEEEEEGQGIHILKFVI